MTKNKLEKLFSKSIKADSRFWGMKLHNNPLAHQNTPADFILSYDEWDDDELHHYTVLAECKEVTCKEGKGRLVHKRLKQLHDLLSFQNKFAASHRSFFVVSFNEERWANSDVYIIPIFEMNEALKNSTKVSFNREEMKELFSKFTVSIDKRGIDLWKLTQ